MRLTTLICAIALLPTASLGNEPSPFDEPCFVYAAVYEAPELFKPDVTERFHIFARGVAAGSGLQGEESFGALMDAYFDTCIEDLDATFREVMVKAGNQVRKED